MPLFQSASAPPSSPILLPNSGGTDFPCTPSSKLEINYTHHHILSFVSDGTSSNTGATLQTLATSIISNSPGKFSASTSVGPNGVVNDATSEMEKTIVINGIVIQYSAESLPDPPTLSYRTKEQLEQLVRDWTSRSMLEINGVAVPLCLWRNLYSRTRPRAWERIKDQWTKYKFIVGGFKSFATPQEFWDSMPVATTKKGAQGIISYRAISNQLRQIRSERDAEDAALAKEEYGDEFDTVFSYRKGGKQMVLRRHQDIARRYRLLKETTVYWDEQDSDIE
jgi:hypothetical protein